MDQNLATFVARLGIDGKDDQEGDDLRQELDTRFR